MEQPNLAPQGPPPMVLQNPLQNQGMFVTQTLVQRNTATTYAGQPINLGVHHLMALSSDVNLQTRCNQYGSTTKTINPSTTSTSTSLNMSLQFMIPPMDGIFKVLRSSLRHVANNPTTRAAFNYSLVDELDQSPSAMSALEVLRAFPSKWKALLFALGVINPIYSRLITFALDQGEPWMPSSVAYQVSFNM